MPRPNANRLLKFAGAASLVAMTAACASNDRRYYSDYQSGYTGSYNTVYEDRYDGYRDGYENAAYRGGGIDAARQAHRRYSDYEAERMDGNCESSVRIRRGETLSDIAEYCDVPVADLIRDNPQIRNPRAVAAGERLRVPAVRGEVYEGSYRYAYRDALYRDASYRDDYDADRWLDSRDGKDVYVIRRGDTLAEIAWRLDVPLRTLYRLNPRVEPRRLEVGQAIYVPDYARTSPRDRGARDYVYYEDEPPLISITPARGPRDGKIRVIGDNFRQGEKVSVYFGDSRNSMTELKIVETDGDGRINEVVTLPDNYGQKEAYFAFRPSKADGYIMSEAYAIDGISRSGNIAASAGDFSNDGRHNGARMRAMQDSIYWGDKITLRAEGFPPDTPVSIYGGPHQNALEKLSEIRSGPSGRFSADVHAPESGRGGDVMFVAAIEDGARTVFSERVRVLNRDRGYAEGYRGASGGYDGYVGDRRGPYSDGYMGAKYQNEDVPMSPQRLERGVETKGVGWFGRLRGNNSRDDYVGDRTPSPVGGVDSAGTSSIVGILTDEGQHCPSLRDDSGNLYTLLGDLEGFDDGDRVLVNGSVRADDRICGQAETVQVYEIAQAPW